VIPLRSAVLGLLDLEWPEGSRATIAVAVGSSVRIRAIDRSCRPLGSERVVTVVPCGFTGLYRLTPRTPLARDLLGRRVHEIVEVRVGAGIARFEILAIGGRAEVDASLTSMFEGTHRTFRSVVASDPVECRCVCRWVGHHGVCLQVVPSGDVYYQRDLGDGTHSIAHCVACCDAIEATDRHRRSSAQPSPTRQMTSGGSAAMTATRTNNRPYRSFTGGRAIRQFAADARRLWRLDLPGRFRRLLCDVVGTRLRAASSATHTRGRR